MTQEQKDANRRYWSTLSDLMQTLRVLLLHRKSLDLRIVYLRAVRTYLDSLEHHRILSPSVLP